MAFKNRSPEENLLIALMALIFAFLTTARVALSVYLYWQQTQDRQAVEAQQQQTQNHLAQLGDAAQAFAQGNPTACIKTVAAIPHDSSVFSQAETLRLSCLNTVAPQWLKEADHLASQQRYVDAMGTLAQITDGSYREAAQQKILNYSGQVITAAKDAYQRGQVQEAIRWVRHIEPTNPWHGEATALLNEWLNESNQNEQAVVTAQSALQAGNLALAQTAAEVISLHPHWAPQRHALLAEIQVAFDRNDQLLAQANQAWQQGDRDRAAQLLAQLPDFEPWLRPKTQLQSAIQAAAQAVNRAEEQEDDEVPVIPLLVAGLGIGWFVTRWR